MSEFTPNPTVVYAVALLSHYQFELRGYTAQELVNLWLRNYSANWVRLGVIEALYQGRYKAVSVEQILAVWARRGQPIFRFTHEFERLISRKLPKSLTARLGTNSTDLAELSLPWLTSTTDRIESTKIQATEQTTDQEDSSFSSVFEEDLNHPVQLDNQFPKPLSNTGISATYDADWSRCELSKQPIHQFTPPPDASGFYLKLKAVAQQQDLPPTNIETSLKNAEESQPTSSAKS